MSEITPAPIPKIEFVEFVQKFPALPMPVILGEDTHHTFSAENDPLPEAMIAQFILPLERKEVDEEFTEYVPCFAIDCEEPFIALVWWKAELLTYQYILATFTEKGAPIDKKVIAFTKVTGDTIHRAVTTIDEDLAIHVAEGTETNHVFDASSSITRLLEILPNGQIVSSL